MAAITAAAIGGAAAIGAGAMAANASNNASKRASRTANSAAERFYDFDDPDYKKMKLDLEELKSQGLITPEMEEQILQDPSLMETVSQDPRLRKAELDALSTLANISGEGGMDAQAMLGFEEARVGSQAAARGAREANKLSAAQRGSSGEGLEFVLNQMADQDAAGQYGMEGLAQAAAANQRDLSALGDLTDLTSTMQNRGIGLDMAKAQAADARNRFNTTSMQDVQQRNVGARNVAQATNLGEKQRIADSNTNIRNAGQQYNKSLEQQKFDNEMARAKGSAGVVDAQTKAQTAAGAGVSQALAGIGKTAGGIGSTISDYYIDQEKEKAKV